MSLKTEKPTNQLTPSPAAGVGLTPRQLQLLKAIHAFQASRCYSPTIAELASELRLSRSTVFEHITELRKKDLLSAYPTRARSLKPTSKAQELLNLLADHGSNSYRQPPTGIPLVGKVAAGLPIEAIEDKDFLSLSSHFGTGDDIFALQVTGDSMLDDGIRDGDFVICRRTPLANNGQLVVAIVDNENATLKRFYKEKTQARLQPANDDYDPIYSDNCRIEAIVVGLLRKF
jgi:repressor LexA